MGHETNEKFDIPLFFPNRDSSHLYAEKKSKQTISVGVGESSTQKNPHTETANTTTFNVCGLENLGFPEFWEIQPSLGSPISELKRS